jgi:HEPN domain-containing protein
MSNPADPLARVERVEEDYLLAISALRRARPLTYGACFHAQQTAEKYLKAVLVAQGQPFPRTHDLVFLYGLCVRSSSTLAPRQADLNVLSTYAVDVRYPGTTPTVIEARQAVPQCRPDTADLPSSSRPRLEALL